MTASGFSSVPAPARWFSKTHTTRKVRFHTITANSRFRAPMVRVFVLSLHVSGMVAEAPTLGTRENNPTPVGIDPSSASGHWLLFVIRLFCTHARTDPPLLAD